MKHKKFLLLILFSFFICGEAISEKFTNPLKNLKKIGVLIERLPMDAIEIGLSEERLKTVVELRFRREGIEITEDTFVQPSLYVIVTVVSNAFNVVLQLYEWVHLDRDPSTSIMCRAFTWQEGRTETHGNDSEYIVSSLSKLLDSFLNDYYKANPKKQDD